MQKSRRKHGPVKAKAVKMLMVLALLAVVGKTRAQTYFINQNFSSASGSTPPTGWNSVLLAGVATDVWRFDNPGSRSPASPISSPFAIFDSDKYSTGSVAENVALETPAFNTTGTSVVRLKWDQHFEAGWGGGAAVEVYNGTSWVQVYSTTTQAVNSPDLDISAQAGNRTGVKVRFRWTGNYSWWWIVDNVQVYGLVPCTGTPAPGNTIAPSPFVCSATNFTLSLQNNFFGIAGLTYQWDSSASGTSWTAISGATSATYTGSQTATRYYRCRVTCSGNTGTSNPLMLSTRCYCTPAATNCGSWDDIIYNVTMGTINNSSGCSGASGYTNYASSVAPARISRGTTPSIAVQVGNGGDDYASVWIDTNHNGTFDANEYKYIGFGSLTVLSNSIFGITNAAKLGTTMMRVRINWNVAYASTEACYADTWGETEDYLVTIVPQTPTANNGQLCGPGNANCSVTSNTGVSSPSMRWYLTPIGGSPIAGQTGTSLSAYPVTTNTVFYVSEVQEGYESERVAVSVTVNPVPVATVTSKTDLICYNGNTGVATTTVTGGTSTFSYSWNTSPVQQTATASNLTAGTYICTVTDSKNCTDTAVVTINNAPFTTLPSVTLNPVNKTICAGTNTSFVVAGTAGLGSISYRWQRSISATGTFDDLADGGVYSGTGTDTLKITNAVPGLNGFRYRCVISGTCSPAAVSTPATLTVNATLPSINISASGNNICAGTPVTFTASINNGGANPVYQWRRNGSLVGTGSTYSPTTLNNGDVVICSLTSNVTCAYPSQVSSNSITMVVYPYVTPSVSIASDKGNAICAGTQVTFTATPANGGTAPTYLWKKNGNNQAGSSNTYVSSTLAQGDVITCVMTSNALCTTPSSSATSNAVTMSVTQNVTPSVTISTPTNSICPAETPVFTATPVNGGTNATYVWSVNGVPQTAYGSSFTGVGLQNGDVVSCSLTSGVTCVTTRTVPSNNIGITVLPVLTPSVSVSATPDTVVCAGTNVTFNAASINGGSVPGYQWYINGVKMNGAVANIYSVSSLSSGDVITCELNSTARCAIPATTMSAPVQMTVTAALVPQLTVTSDKGNVVVEGDTVTFKAAALNGGYMPVYVWMRNGVPTGDSSDTYTVWNLEANDAISAVVYSTMSCTNPDSAVSNTINMMVIPASVRSVNHMLRDVKLYPNPNRAMFTVEADVPAGNVWIEVANSVGQAVYRESCDVSGTSLKKEITLSNVADGVYFLHVITAEERITKRFVVQH